MEIDVMLQKGMSTDRIYSTIAKKKAESVSQRVTSPKVIDNGKYAFKKAYKGNNQQDMRSEAAVLVSSLQTIPLVNSVTFTKEQYVSVNFLPSICWTIFSDSVFLEMLFSVWTQHLNLMVFGWPIQHRRMRNWSI